MAVLPAISPGTKFLPGDVFQGCSEPFTFIERIRCRWTVDFADPLTSCTDEELLDRFREGQTEAFGELVRRYERELYGYLRRYLGNGALAEDVFQNTFLQLYKKIEQYEPGRPVRPWLYTIATNQAIDALRRQGRHQAVSLDEKREISANGEVRGLLNLLEEQGEGPESRLEGEELREKIRASVDALPEVMKQVILLAYYQGLKYREIAEILGIPVGTVKSRLHAALVKLQKAWRELSLREV
ncbi:MAG: DNA-directed RNA polymerase sigma-70 factor [Gemmatales bacterium]|nr:MAG: DNA-directed RNA polymerase sigma-70 factor [Gemmatales bacterium]